MSQLVAWSLLSSRLYSAVKKAAARLVAPSRSQQLGANHLERPSTLDLRPPSGLRMGKLVASLKKRRRSNNLIANSWGGGVTG